MRASEFASRPPRMVTAPIMFGDHLGFSITFDANKVTRRWATTADDRPSAYSFYEAMCEVITEWTLENDDGTPYPLDPEKIAELNLTIPDEKAWLEQMVRASVPASEEGNDSATTSSTPPSVSSSMPGDPLNGQEPSTLPAPSASPLPT